MLKPGRRWQALDGELLSGAPTSDEHRALLCAVERDWRLPPMVPWHDVLAMLARTGFTDVEEQDLSAEALPASLQVRGVFLAASFLNPGMCETNPAPQEFMDAAVRSA